MPFPKICSAPLLGAKNAPVTHSGPEFRLLAVLTLVAALLLCACAPAKAPQTGTDDLAKGAGYYLPALSELAPASEVWRREPPFTEKELAAFVRDVRGIQTMNARDTVDYLLRDRGWTRERLRYMDVKVAFMVMAIDSDNLASLSHAGPYYLPPSREEISAVQKYYPALSNMLKAQSRAGD